MLCVAAPRSHLLAPPPAGHRQRHFGLGPRPHPAHLAHAAARPAVASASRITQAAPIVLAEAAALGLWQPALVAAAAPYVAGAAAGAALLTGLSFDGKVGGEASWCCRFFSACLRRNLQHRPLARGTALLRSCRRQSSYLGCPSSAALAFFAGPEECSPGSSWTDGCGAAGAVPGPGSPGSRPCTGPHRSAGRGGKGGCSRCCRQDRFLEAANQSILADFVARQTP